MTGWLAAGAARPVAPTLPADAPGAARTPVRPESFPHAAPRRRELVAIAATAITLRALVALVVIVTGHVSFHDFTSLRDGASYIAFARALLGDASELTPFDRRVFVGYPALIAALGATGLSLPVAAVAISWVGSGVAAAASAVLCEDRRVGWWMTFFTPSFLMYSTVVMSEGALLALTVVGLLVALRGRSVLGGALLGAAGLVRPVACFAVLGFLVFAVRERRWGRAAVVTLTSGVVVLAGYLLLQRWTGDALQGVKTYDSVYAGRIVDVPFRAILLTPLSTEVPPWKVAFVWAHVLLALAGCWLGARSWLRARVGSPPIASIAPPWLAANTLFVLSVGSMWGFHELHRFLLAALPALLWSLRGALPTGRRATLALAVAAAAASVGFATFGLGAH